MIYGGKIMEKYLHKYVFLKNGRWFYVMDIAGEQLYLYDEIDKVKIYGSFRDEDIDHVADEVCKAVTVE